MTGEHTINHVVSILRNEKNNFYSNLDTKVVTNDRIFWKTVKPFISGKVTMHFKINLVEGKKKKKNSCDDQIVKTFSECTL